MEPPQSPVPLHHRMRHKFKTVFVFLVLLMSGIFIYSASTGSSNILTTAIIGAPVEAELPTEPFSLSAELVLPELVINVAETALEITTQKVGGDLVLDSLQFAAPGDSEIIIYGYSGEIIITPKAIVQLRGTAASIIMNEGDITKSAEPLSIVTNNLAIGSFRISELTLDSFSFVSSGTIEVPGRGSFEVNDERIAITPFTGIVSADTSQLTLEGESSELIIESEPKVVIS